MKLKHFLYRKHKACKDFFVPLQPQFWNYMEYRYLFSNMKLKFLYIFCLLGITLSCTQEQDFSQDDVNLTPAQKQEPTIDRGNRVPVRFYDSNVSIATSRATDSAFEEGDAIGIFVVNKGETKTDSLVASGNYADNLEYRLDTDGFIPVADSIWQYEKMKLDLVYYAVYPYISDITPVFTFSAFEDQTNHYYYTLSDLSCQKKESKDCNVSLALNHMMSKIVVRLQGQNIDQSNISVTLTDMRLSANVNLNKMEVTATGSATPSIKCEENTSLATSTERVFHAIIAPQTLTTASGLIIRTPAETKSVPLPRACRLTSGKQWTLNYDVDIDSEGYIYVSFGGDEEGGQHVD